MTGSLNLIIRLKEDWISAITGWSLGSLQEARRVYFDQSTLLSRALVLRRAIGSMENDVATGAPSLNGCDWLLLSLVLDLEKVETLAIDDNRLADLLLRGFEEAGRSVRPELFSTSSIQASGLRLTAFESVLECKEAIAPLTIVYGTPRVLPPRFVDACSGSSISMLASISPAAWSSSLVWLSSAENHHRIDAARGRLETLLASDEFDPLFLIERLEVVGGMTRGGTSQRQNLAERCRMLEQRVHELETSGLVRYHGLLRDVTRRRR